MYFSFISTMLILLVKARIHPIGIDNSEHFEERFMSFMVNKIIGTMVKKKCGFDKCIINKETTVKVNDIVAIKLKISAKHYENIQNKIQEKEEPFYVCECDAITWLEECTLTQVSKFELDEQR